MKLFIYAALTTALLSSNIARANTEPKPPDPDMILRTIDAVRAPNLDTYLADIVIQTRHGDKKDADVHYSMLTSKAYGSILTAKDGDQLGQKILSTTRGFWFFAPRTHRAIRLTPNQLLRGQASVGDISNLSFAQDYAVENLIKSATSSDKQEWTIRLKAKSSHATYAKIDLLTTEDGVPLSGKLYARSGRLLKTIKFGKIVSISGLPLISTMTYIDGINPTAQTQVGYKRVESARAHRGSFTVEALTLR